MKLKKTSILATFFLACLMLAPSAYSGDTFYSKYSTIRADVVGIRDASSGTKLWWCPEGSKEYCDSTAVENKGKDGQITGNTSNFVYDGDGVNNGQQGTIHVEISQPTIYNPLKLEGSGLFQKGGKWLTSFTESIYEGRFAIDLAAGEENVHAKLWFLHMNIKVHLGSKKDKSWFFSPGVYRKEYGEIVVLIRLMPQVIDSVYIEDEFSTSGFDSKKQKLGDLHFGPHVVEAARVRTDGRFGPNKTDTSGVRWNSGSSGQLSYNPADTWGFPLAQTEIDLISQSARENPEESIGLSQNSSIEKSWFNRPVYLAVHFDHLKVGKHKRIIDGREEKVWVSPIAQIDAVIHTYIIGEWENKPIDIVKTADIPVQITKDDSFWTKLKNGFGLFSGLGDIFTYLKWIGLGFVTVVALLKLNWYRRKLQSRN